MGRLGEDQSNPHCSPGGEAVQSVLDHLGSLWINALDLVDQGSQGLELREAGDPSVLQGFPGTHRQVQAIERIVRVLG
jgi:hypothetical protein